MRQAKSYKKRRTGRAYFPPEPEDKSNIEKMCVLCKYHPSNTQTEMPSEDIELVSLRKQLDEATKYIKALEEREF